MSQQPPTAPNSSPTLPNGAPPAPASSSTVGAGAESSSQNNDTNNSNAGAAAAPPPMPLPPTRKDVTLREFLSTMEDHAPIIPDAVTDYYLSLSGLSTSDVRLKRLLALATQKFIADIAADAYQYSRIRQNSSNAAPGGGGGGGGGGAVVVPGVPAVGGGGGAQLKPTARPGFGGAGGSGGSSGRTVLTMEDLGSAVGEYGVNTRRPEFYR